MKIKDLKDLETFIKCQKIMIHVKTVNGLCDVQLSDYANEKQYTFIDIDLIYALNSVAQQYLKEKHKLTLVH